MDAFLQGLGQSVGTGIGLLVGIVAGVIIEIRVKQHQQKQVEKDNVQAFIAELTVNLELISTKIADLKTILGAVSTDFSTRNFPNFLNLSEVASDITLGMLQSGRLYRLLDTAIISKLRGAFRLWFSPYADSRLSQTITKAQHWYTESRNNNDALVWKDKYKPYYVHELEFWLHSLQQSRDTFQGVIKTLDTRS